jgi:hypothetical protein
VAALVVSETRLGARQKTIALRLLSRKLASAPHGFGLFTHALHRRLLVEAPQLHLAENSLALHPLFENAQGLVYIVFTHKDLQLTSDPGWRRHTSLPRFSRITRNPGFEAATNSEIPAGPCDGRFLGKSGIGAT